MAPKLRGQDAPLLNLFLQTFYKKIFFEVLQL